MDEAFDIRYRGLVALSRSARGEHTRETTSKRLRVYGEELSRDTVEAHLQVNEILRDHLHQTFTPRDLEVFVLQIVSAYEKGMSGRVQLFRDWVFEKNGYSHVPENIELDWVWFIEWFHHVLDSKESPRLLGAQLHYIVSFLLHPFYDGAGRVSRDLVDFLYMRRGFTPPDWSRLSQENYFDRIMTLQNTYDLLGSVEVILSCERDSCADIINNMRIEPCRLEKAMEEQLHTKDLSLRDIPQLQSIMRAQGVEISEERLSDIFREVRDIEKTDTMGFRVFIREVLRNVRKRVR